jgi:Tfp pilus assembly protein PilO
MTITANYEGSYANLMRFIHEIDRSPRLLIIEALNAAPQQGSGILNISMKIDTFVREDGSRP